MNTKHHNQGDKVRTTEQSTKTSHVATGIFALLGALFRGKGSGALKTGQGSGASSPTALLATLATAAATLLASAGLTAALPASASAYATTEGPPVFSSAPGLPDGRVYELASPPNKDGNEAGASSLLFTGNLPGNLRYSVASGEGDSVLFEGTGPMGEDSSPDSLYFVATRTGSGWKTRSVAPSPEQSASQLGPIFAAAKQLDISPDFSHAMVVGSATLAPKECPGDTYLTGPDPFVPAICPGGGTPVGGTPDFGTVYFSGPPQLPEDSSRIEGDGFYEYREGVLREAGVLPDGSLSPFGAVSTTLDTKGNAAEDILGNPISADGSRAFFLSPTPASCEQNGGHNNCATNPPELYVREDGTRTLLVSKDTLLPEAGGLPAAAPDGVLGTFFSFAALSHKGYAYLFASPDGSQAFFQSDDALTKPAEEAGLGTAPKTYDFDVDTGALTYLPDVVGRIFATDADGSSLVFVRPKVEGALGSGAGAEPAELDLWSAGTGGGSVTPVVQLPGGEEVEPVRMSSDGSVLVFSTASKIPGFNDGGVNFLNKSALPIPDIQIFRYDARANTLGCVSCAPAGVAPGNASMSILQEGLSRNNGGGDVGMVEERGISSNGDRVFFQSSARLVPQVTNTGTTIPASEHLGLEEQGVNVYEWENGVVYLLNGGKSGRDTYFLDNSENGNDVFFATTEELVPGDRDGGFSVYDARVPRRGDNPPATAVPCEGSVCQGPTNVPSPLTPPSSATFSGLGNPTPEVTTQPPAKVTTKAVKCGKGFTKKNDKCVKDKKKTKAKKANSDRRAGR
jgi:hypothetical protein